ncbi:hypothetical protein AYI69_g4986 [Smittium culicis]|uniref:Uncharacterized protein n=1 Tax=Smittium culicis TaxID=133412 RepID=A0A1R1Y996_9FUNG|nr:hypothetical protein AYI69_g8409 [Smittium culicis]OMJ23438.1 hypothetical protein AYI69_g4986 [Smittium culicis]
MDDLIAQYNNVHSSGLPLISELAASKGQNSSSSDSTPSQTVHADLKQSDIEYKLSAIIQNLSDILTEMYLCANAMDQSTQNAGKCSDLGTISTTETNSPDSKSDSINLHSLCLQYEKETQLKELVVNLVSSSDSLCPKEQLGHLVSLYRHYLYIVK